MADASEYGKMEDAMEIDQFQVKVERDVKTTITTGTKRKGVPVVSSDSQVF